MKLTYPGPHEGVTILATGQKAQRGVATEIADEAVAASLVEQGWESPKPKTPKTTTPAAEATDKEKP
jgi:hypothetical protein